MFNANEYNENAGNFTPKIINPGTHILQVRDVFIDIPPYDTNAMFLVLFLETKPLGGDFEGADVDKNDPSKGKHLGQIGRVKNGRYAFSTYEYQGKIIERDQQLFKYLMKMADQLNVLEDIKKSGIQTSDITDYVEKVKPYFIGKWGMFTVGGQEYYTEGYDRPNYRLLFPKMDYKNKLFPFSAKKDQNNQILNLLPFNEKEHIIIAEKKDAAAAAPVGGFEPTGFGAAPAAAPQAQPSQSGDLFGGMPQAAPQAAPQSTGLFDPTPAPAQNTAAPAPAQTPPVQKAPAPQMNTEAMLAERPDDDLPF